MYKEIKLVKIETHCAKETAGSDENNSEMAVLQPAYSATGSQGMLPSCPG